MIEVILTPAEIATLPDRDLRSTTCVVFDVLRATSTIVAALGAGARRIYPALNPEEARGIRQNHLPSALLGGERGGLRIDGFDLGNSPREYTPDVVADRDVITTTTNGTVALRACAGAQRVIAGAWVNLDAVAQWILAHVTPADRILLVCAGTGTEFALEDGLAAGALAARLMPPAQIADDAARAMIALYERHGHDALTAFQSSANGRRLVEIGLGQDVGWCARDSAVDLVAIMRDGAIERA